MRDFNKRLPNLSPRLAKLNPSEWNGTWNIRNFAQQSGFQKRRDFFSPFYLRLYLAAFIYLYVYVQKYNPLMHQEIIAVIPKVIRNFIF